jgi:hypothetical protein
MLKPVADAAGFNIQQPAKMRCDNSEKPTRSITARYAQRYSAP